MPIIHLFILVQLYIQRYLHFVLSLTPENYLQAKQLQHTKFPRLHQNLTKISGWENVPGNIWPPNMNPVIHNMTAPGHIADLSTRKHILLTDMERPSKKLANSKAKLFDLLPEDIINVIVLWLVITEHNEKFTSVLERLTIPCNTFLHIKANQA